MNFQLSSILDTFYWSFGYCSIYWKKLINSNINIFKGYMQLSMYMFARNKRILCQYWRNTFAFCNILPFFFFFFFVLFSIVQNQIFDLRKFLGTAKNFLKSKIFLKSNTPSSLKYANWKYYFYFYDPRYYVVYC